MKYRLLLIASLLTVGIGFSLLLQQITPQSSHRPLRGVSDALTKPKAEQATGTAQPALPPVHSITLPNHVYQSFNNCGPATLSMYLHYLGTARTQEELGATIRPYQNAAGDNDDKSVTLPELARAAEAEGYLAYYRPAGTMELLKRFVAAEIPVIVRTWLVDGDDIGHYRIVRGYDDTSGVILQDDSYQGPDRTYSYTAFENIWRPFQHEYLIIIPRSKQQQAAAIMGDSIDEHFAWTSARAQSQKDAVAYPDSPYPVFNESIAEYHLGNYPRSIELYEQVAQQLPNHILWYQVEPIEAYAKLGNRERVFAISDAILNGGNRAYSELYMIRAGMYEKAGDIEAARAEYEQAVFYNIHMKEAQNALVRLTQIQ